MEPPRSLGADIRVSHISPKEGEIWGTLWSARGREAEDGSQEMVIDSNEAVACLS